MTLLCGGAALLARWAFRRVEVIGGSMAPTFAPGDRLLVVRRYRRLRVGDVVVFRDPASPGRELVKRVATVQGGSVVLLGDNPAGSTDSRSFGPVDASAVSGLVVRRYRGS